MSSKKRTYKFLAFLLTFILLLTSINFTSFAQSNENEGKYIVTFKDQSAKEKYVKDKTKGKKVKKNFEKQSSVAVELTDTDIADLSADPDVLYVEADSAVEILSTGKPDNADNAVKNMKNGEQTIPWGVTAVGAASTLNKYDGKNVKVAIFDTGVANHEDLTISGGVSFVDYTTSYSDDNGHGSHVAGIISANNNKLGVVGIAPSAEIYAVKILNQNGGGNYSNVIAALEWAIDNNINIINMSLGGNADNMALHTAIQEATNAGIIIVAAAGNNGIGEDTITYPARYPEVVSVGAVDENYNVASFSSRGPELDIVAPGKSVLSTINDGTYATMSGTSMAAPYVTGAFAALESKNKKLTSTELIDKIYATATPLGDSNTYGHGFLNLAYAEGEVNGAVIAVTINNPEPTSSNNPNNNEITNPAPTDNPNPTSPDNPNNGGITNPAPTSPDNPNNNEKSDRRLKYDQLLEGNYYAGELLEKFHELFGDNYTSEYIKEHYTEIFDITPAEVDMGIINLLVALSPCEVNISSQTADGETHYVSEWTCDVAPIEQESPPEMATPLISINPINAGQSVDNTTNEYPTTDEINNISELNIDTALIDNDNQLSENSTNAQTSQESTDYISESAYSSSDEITASVTNGYPTIANVTTTNTSITFDLTYTTNGDANNCLLMYDLGKEVWYYYFGQGYGKPIGTNQRYTISGLIAGNVYSIYAKTYDFTSASWKETTVKVQTTGAKTLSLTKTASTLSSITVNVGFPAEGVWGNVLKIYQDKTWVDVPGASLYTNSGTYTITGLTPGVIYQIYTQYYNHLTSTWSSTIQIQETPLLPAENMQTYTKTNFIFNFDKWFADLFSAGRLDTFMNKVDQAYTTEWNLVGGTKPYSGNKMTLQTSRTMYLSYPIAEGMSGQTITWSIYSPTYSAAQVHILKMNQLNANITEIPIHEIGHNFDKPSWTFDAEALTVFKIYNYMQTTNDTMAVAGYDQLIVGGTGFKTYIKSYANRIGQPNYDVAMAQGVYSPYSLAYRLATIADAVGWDAVKKTFAYFDTLFSASVPNTNIGKLNLFLTKLYDYSPNKPDVIAMITPQEKTIFSNYLGGGTIDYYKAPVTGVSIVNKPSMPSAMKVGDTFNCTYSITPSNALERDMTWSSSNTSVATVDPVSLQGCITAKGLGTATITVRSTSNPNAYDTVNVTVLEGFNYNSTTYNASLATQCAEYAMLAYDEMDKNSSGLYFDSKTKKSTPTALISKLGTDNFKNIISYNYHDTIDSNVSFTLANKQVSFNGSARTLIAVIIRGTDGVEWQGNMDVTGSTYNSTMNEHYSFKQAVTNTRNDGVMDRLTSYISTNSITNPVYLITGHSRGAAVANLLADTLSTSAGAVNVFAYTFATPNNTKIPNASRTNIFNFCFDDDFVPQVPLPAWGYGKHGITYTKTAGILYTSNASFKNDINSFLSSSNRSAASFALSSTQSLLSYVSSNWGTVQKYYTQIYKDVTGTDKTLYDFFRNTVAPAAMGDNLTAYYNIFREGGNVNITYYTQIANFFLGGSGAPVPFWNDYIYDAHSPFTYYTAVKYGLFK